MGHYTLICEERGLLRVWLTPDLWGHGVSTKPAAVPSYYYLTDRLSSVIGVINDSGKWVNDYWYTPFGDYAGGDSANASAGVPWVPWRFTGEWFDGVSVDRGYYKIGLRYYDHAMNRWTQTDPVERVVNPMQPAEAQPYTYAGTNPTNQTDPTGAYSWEEFGGDVLAALAGASGAAIGGGVGLLGGPAAQPRVDTWGEPVPAAWSAKPIPRTTLVSATSLGIVEETSR